MTGPVFLKMIVPVFRSFSFNGLSTIVFHILTHQYNVAVFINSD